MEARVALDVTEKQLVELFHHTNTGFFFSAAVRK
jgi:hypothetical protein